MALGTRAACQFLVTIPGFGIRHGSLISAIQAFVSFWPSNRTALEAIGQSRPRRPVLSFQPSADVEARWIR
jgi:hypothetical protein